MYARGMSTRGIPGTSSGTGHLHDLYGIDVSPDLISAVTGAVLEEVASASHGLWSRQRSHLISRKNPLSANPADTTMR